ncbi:hypothetical protein C8F04DRAFT_1194659 [Mycena alexandri]|uniref:Uncharacterized protein n=1 Tax=Mycena alexandri TaxID=1745969 RepID=A0AAD6WRD9_9AGAR|nr:hypothetical protein C8F04DRAFT_1194659 [Mycena alexandri]
MLGPQDIQNSVKRSAYGPRKGGGAANKAARRRQDAPKLVSKTPSIDGDLDERHEAELARRSSTRTPSESVFSFQDYRAKDYFVLEAARCSPTPDERLVCDALAALANGAGGSIGRVATEPSHSAGAPARASPPPAMACTVEEAEIGRLSRKAESWVSPFQDEFVDSTFTHLPEGVAPLTVFQKESLRTTGTIGLLTPVQSAQMRVATLNAGALTPPTPEEAAGWLYQQRPANWSVLDHTRGFEMIQWRTGIFKAHRRARLAGEVLDDMPRWTQLDDVVCEADSARPYSPTDDHRSEF